MIKKLLQKSKSYDNRRLLYNFMSLSLLQGTNYLLPLITFPYLVRVLGVDKFGLLAFAGATIAYFHILTDYGFNLTATREVSIYRENHTKLEEIFGSVMFIKFILMLVSLILLLILFYSFEMFGKNSEVYVLTFGMVIGQVLFPQWFFQGMEQMKYIAFLNILTKLFFTIAVFFFITTEDDFWKVPLLNSLGQIGVGIIAIYIIKRQFGVRFHMQEFSILKRYLVQGWYVFLSNMAISLYTISTTFILGLFTNNTVVGYYAIAEKIKGVVQGFLGPASQALYPYISRKIKKDPSAGLRFIKKAVLVIGSASFLLSLLLFISAPKIIHLIAGAEYERSIVVLQIIAFLPFIVSLSNLFGIQTMLNFDRKKAFSRILIAGSVLNVLLSLFLVPKFEEVGSALSVVVVEMGITLTMFFYLQRSGINIIRGRVDG